MGIGPSVFLYTSYYVDDIVVHGLVVEEPRSVKYNSRSKNDMQRQTGRHCPLFN